MFYVRISPRLEEFSSLKSYYICTAIIHVLPQTGYCLFNAFQNQRETAMEGLRRRKEREVRQQLAHSTNKAPWKTLETWH